MHGQAEQHDADGRQQLVRGRAAADAGDHSKVRDGRLSAVDGDRLETVRGVQVFHVEYRYNSWLTDDVI